MRNRVYTAVLVALFLANTAVVVNMIDTQKSAMRVLDNVVDMGQRESAEFDRLEVAYGSVLAKPYFDGAEFKEFSRAATAEQMDAYFGPARTVDEKTVVDGFSLPGYKGRARTAIKTTRNADRSYAKDFPVLIAMSTIKEGCLGNRSTEKEWLAAYGIETPKPLDLLRAKVQTEIQNQATEEDCTDIEAKGGFEGLS
jgi:hypothetical protein